MFLGKTQKLKKLWLNRWRAAGREHAAPHLRAAQANELVGVLLLVVGDAALAKHLWRAGPAGSDEHASFTFRLQFTRRHEGVGARACRARGPVGQ